LPSRIDRSIPYFASSASLGLVNSTKPRPRPSLHTADIQYQLAVAKQENTVSKAAIRSCIPCVVIPWTVHISAWPISLSLIPKILAPAAAKTQYKKTKFK